MFHVSSTLQMFQNRNKKDGLQEPQKNYFIFFHTTKHRQDVIMCLNTLCISQVFEIVL